MNFKFFPVVLCILFFCSCSIQKRIYRDGFYVGSIKSENRIQPTSKQNIAAAKEVFNPLSSYASVATETFEKIKLLSPDTCGDMIYLKNGSEFPAEIIELTDDKIRYRLCDKPERKIMSLKKHKVLMLKFSNGAIESFKNDSIDILDPPVHPLANVAFCFALATILFMVLGFLNPLFFLLAIASFITSAVSAFKGKKEINATPYEYRGRKLIKTALIILLVLSSLLLLVSASL